MIFPENLETSFEGRSHGIESSTDRNGEFFALCPTLDPAKSSKKCRDVFKKHAFSKAPFFIRNQRYQALIGSFMVKDPKFLSYHSKILNNSQCPAMQKARQGGFPAMVSWLSHDQRGSEQRLFPLTVGWTCGMTYKSSKLPRWREPKSRSDWQVLH